MQIYDDQTNGKKNEAGIVDKGEITLTPDTAFLLVEEGIADIVVDEPFEYNV